MICTGTSLAAKMKKGAALFGGKTSGDNKKVGGSNPTTAMQVEKR